MTRGRWADDAGSIVIGLMLIMAVAMVSISLTALLAFQSSSLLSKQRMGEARQAAYNAYVLSTFALAAATPGQMDGIPVGTESTEVDWNPTELDNVYNRWWVTTDGSGAVVVHAEGRSGPLTGTAVDSAVHSRYVVDLTYDYSANLWRASAIRPEAQ